MHLILCVISFYRILVSVIPFFVELEADTINVCNEPMDCWGCPDSVCKSLWFFWTDRLCFSSQTRQNTRHMFCESHRQIDRVRQSCESTTQTVKTSKDIFLSCESCELNESSNEYFDTDERKSVLFNNLSFNTN